MLVAQKPSGCSWGLKQGFLIFSEASSSFSRQDSLTDLVAYRISVKPELPICGCISSESFRLLTVLDQPGFLCVVESPLIPAWRRLTTSDLEQESLLIKVPRRIQKVHQCWTASCTESTFVKLYPSLDHLGIQG